MSTLYVDNLQPNLGSGVHVAGHVIQTVTAGLPSVASGSTSVNASPTNHSSWYAIFNQSFTPHSANSTIYVSAGPVVAYSIGGNDKGLQIAICEDASGTVRPFLPTGSVFDSDYESQGLFFTGTSNIDGSNFWLPIVTQCYTPSWGTTAANISLRIASENANTINYYTKGRYNVTTMVIMEIAQ